MNLGIIVKKEKNYTSRDVVNKLGKILKTKKIGHTGTLDPMAEGVLICLVGKYTKLASLITTEDKEYIANIKLGIETDTLDITGKIIEEENPRLLEVSEIMETLANFKGDYLQTIPLFSAKHIGGKRLYEYARNNEPVALPQNWVKIKEIEFLSYQENQISFRAVVSKGTYIRSLVKDICAKLEVKGCMASLVRTRQGKFTIENASTLAEIENNNYKVLKIDDLLDLTILNISDDLRKKVINGNVITLEAEGFVLFKDNATEIALYYFEEGIGHLKILF